jgi:pimeloyl-ACP methyl ester carboxylesterase
LGPAFAPGLSHLGTDEVRIKPRPLSLLAASAALAFASAAGAQAPDGGGRWADLDHCELSAAGGRVTASARCGSLSVPEDPQASDGREIELAFAVLPARAGEPEPDAVAFLAGGPGQSARDMLPIMQRPLRDVNRTRDLIFLDQRGTGGSNALDCQFEGEDHMWLEPDWEQVNQQLRECLQRWDADVRHYTTTHAAADLETLRRTYEIPQLNLVGGSYGTRLAQVYLRNYPQQVRSVVLDGVVPTRLALGSEHAVMLDRAIERLFAACGERERCSETFPELDQAFETLKARYRDDAPTITITHPRTGQGMDLRFSRDVLAAALRFLAYSPESQMLIPYLVHEAAVTGSAERLASQAMIVTDRMDEMLAIGLNFAVGCSEDWPVWPREMDHGDTLLGNSMEELFAEVCAWWPAGDRPADFHQPFDSEAPILLLSGELDPVTPPEYGEEAAEQYSNSLHLVAEGRGHIVMTNACMRRIVTEFIDRATVDDLDTECMDRIGPEPFFLDLLGPAP